MKFSHSKLNVVLNNPCDYYLSYVQGIQLKQEKSALSIGSAVHYGIENNTEDLEDYYKTSGNVKQRFEYGKDEILAEAMVHGYLKNRKKLFDQILTDESGAQLKLMDEQHELTLYTKLDNVEFMGIIDLLLLTDKGFVLVDYKTSSQEPDWDKYLEQIYRYLILLKHNFPDTPVYKFGIINIKKSMIRQKKDENNEQFLRRLKDEYEVADEEYITYHEFSSNSISESRYKDYLVNLNMACNSAKAIIDQEMFYVNYSNTTGMYGKGDYYDIYYHTPDAYVLYEIKDKIWDDEMNQFMLKRDCRPIDLETIDRSKKYINHYVDFKREYKEQNSDKEDFFNYLKSKYETDDTLLKLYWHTLEKDAEQC